MAAVVFTSAATPHERNYWPFWVNQGADTEGVERWTSLGPLIYGSHNQPGDTLQGFRPLYHTYAGADGSTSRSILYPLWYREYDAATDDNKWTILNLINSRSSTARDDRFSVWPVYFSRDTGEPETSYKAFFPIYGDIKLRFGQSRIKWAPFPLYVRSENSGLVTTSTPWPFIKTYHGDGHEGFDLWPLFGHRAKPGVSDHRFLLWPLFYSRSDGLDTDEPHRRSGFLPFYATETAAGYHSRTYVWPFFGYSERTAPTAYHQTNYFWPLWVQGRGEHRYVNRWAPFYTHSVTPSRTQTWVLWPLWRNRRWDSEQLHHQRRQLLYFVYHSEVQTSRQSPGLPAATKQHLWPLVSHWDNGAGRVQWQVLSPLEVFFPHSERVRQMWSPLFALYRYNQSAAGEYRHSLLWNGVTYARSVSEQTREFHLGPLLSYTADTGSSQWGFLAGLLRINHDSAGQLSASSRLLSFSP
jgi:hypothetical protein